MGQLGFTDSILQENLIPGKKFEKETEEKIKKAFNKPVIIYGAGSVGLIFLEYFKSIGIPILAVCDNYKCGKVLPSGEEIKLFSNIYNKYKNYIIFIASLTFYDEIKLDILKYVTPDKIINLPAVRYMPGIPKFINCTPSCEECRSFFNRQRKHIDYIISLMSDVKSKIILSAIIRSKITDNLEYISGVSEKNQYFPSDIIKFNSNEVFIDGGAFNGDTLNEFIKCSGSRFSKAYCFEPGIRQSEKFRSTYKDLILKDKVVLIQKGLWDKSEILSFIDKNSSNSRISAGSEDNKIQTVSIDEIVPKEEKVTFIKMDIEGSELKALKGAEKTILRNKPKLAICIYHKPEDIFHIPEYIVSLNLGYRFYIRHYGMAPLQFDETVLYAI